MNNDKNRELADIAIICGFINQLVNNPRVAISSQKIRKLDSKLLELSNLFIDQLLQDDNALENIQKPCLEVKEKNVEQEQVNIVKNALVKLPENKSELKKKGGRPKIVRNGEELQCNKPSKQEIIEASNISLEQEILENLK